MSLAVCLLAYSLVVAVLTPDALRGATRSGADPRMAIAVWVLAIGSLPAAWLGAITLAGAELILAGGDLAEVLAGCVAALRGAATGAYGAPAQVGLLALTVLVAIGLAVLVVRLGRILRRARRHTHRHADAARLLGQMDETLGALVVDVPDRLAYAVAGRPHTIVLSRPTLAALDSAQLQAVLAHERAHLAGRHHLLLAAARALATTMPWIRLFTEGSRELSRLVEMSADDAAASAHGSRTLVGALLALAAGPARPDGALAAAATAVADRAERLLFPPTAEHQRADRLRLRLAVTALLTAPVLVLALSWLCEALISP
ncbi:M48 family metalloprotease [Pseudonocardia sp. MH-G8]|uniref:M48 family metalloprotease n=1 Tax=Pseudonocardia sp. MH-G8 TaxID=1854588 RepID=UPI000BA13832|nr:M48 family metalloprotease [Pseudonocardia sp. MH-G8]OZM76376.1 peptidase M48 [Pseudonocardia sp. MH-G8]